MGSEVARADSGCISLERLEELPSGGVQSPKCSLSLVCHLTQCIIKIQHCFGVQTKQQGCQVEISVAVRHRNDVPYPTL